MTRPTYSRRDLGWALLIGQATLIANGWPLGGGAGSSFFAALAYNTLQFGLPCVLGLKLADAWVDGGRGPAWLAYPAVVLATVGLGVWAIAPSLYPLLGKEDWWTPFNDWALASTTVVWHGIGVGIYVQMRMSSRAQARLLVLQQHAAAHERQLAAANLLALQARVEPDLLFERLQRIDQELAEAPGRAEARLAALIDLLRAQQPHLKMDVSTLAREVEAVRAYARLMSQDGHNTERLQLVQMAELPDWPLAPMVLLPLVRPLLDHSRTLWSLTLRGSVEPRPARAELLLQALGPDAASSQAAAAQVPVAELRHRLRTVHGDQAMLDALPNEAGGLAAFRLTWPLQPAPTSP